MNKLVTDTLRGYTLFAAVVTSKRNITVVCGIGAYIPHRYHFVNENKTWSEAQTYCREKYTDLATINNMGEMKKLNNTLKEKTANQTWIGLKRYDTGKWQWSLTDQSSYGDRDNYRNWHSGQPDNFNGIEFCVEMYSVRDDGPWNDNNCKKSQSFICYDEKNTNNNRYILINETKTWYDAQTYCREKNTDLVSVRNQTENEKIQRMIPNVVANGVWIGLFNDSWKWSDQSTSSFRYWSSDKPSGGLKCAAVSESEQRYWSDVDCTEKLLFICHENKLILVNQNLTWKEALNYCRNHHHDLVSVWTEEMQPLVKKVAQNASTEHVWLGLHHTCALGFWYWVTGEMICYQDWAPGNGTEFEDCSYEERTGAVQSGGEQKWISLPQSYKLNFICSNYAEMGLKLLSVILFFSVLCGIGAYIPHRYHFVNEDKTWSEAQTYCREKYTDLATINNMGEMKKLNNTLKKETVKRAWIGLKRNDTGEWQWSLTDQTFYRDGDNYRNWDEEEPNNSGGNEFCVLMALNGKWQDWKCDLLRQFVCYEEKKTDNNRYTLINENKTWYDAQTYCRENYTDLVSVRNQTENEEIKGMIPNVTDVRVWIGLFYDSWKWSDQSNSSFRYWSSDKPSGGLNCATVSESEQRYWSDVNCTKKLPFICHENKLILVNQNLAWKEALNYCRNHHHDLVSVRTKEMQPLVKKVAQNASTEHVWLGLRHTCALGFWYWVTGEMICYQDWAPGNGTEFEDCSHEERTGAVQSGGEQKWISLPQSSKLNFICSNYAG